MSYVGDQIEIETSTDTVEQVKEALGSTVEIEESPAEAEEQEEQPPVKALADKEQESDEGEPIDDEESDEAEEEAEEKPKKADQVNLSRLNKEIRRRKEAERKLEETRKPPEKAEEETRPQTFSGRAEPKIEDYEGKPDKYPDPYGALIKEHGAWVRDETRGEIAYENQQAEAKRVQEERVSKFVALRPKTIERHPDYNEVVGAAKDINVSDVMTDFLYESDYGPDVMYHLAEHPEEVERILGFRTYRGQIREMEKLETEIAKAIAPDDAEEEAEAAKPVLKRNPAPKTISKAPAPPSRLKPAGPGPKSLRELAGPEDRTGVDIEFSPELERAEKAKRGT